MARRRSFPTPVRAGSGSKGLSQPATAGTPASRVIEARRGRGCESRLGYWPAPGALRSRRIETGLRNRGHHCAARVNKADKTSPETRASLLLPLTRSWLDRPRLCSRVAAALGRTSHHSGLGGHPALGIAAPNTHRFCPGVHVAGVGCTECMVRVARVQPLMGSPGRRPLPLNRVRRRLDHSDLVVASQPLVPTSGAAGVLIRRPASHRSGLRP